MKMIWNTGVFRAAVCVTLGLSCLAASTGCSVRKSSTVAETSTVAVYGADETYAPGVREKAGTVSMSLDTVRIITWNEHDVLGNLIEVHKYICAHVTLTNDSAEDMDLTLSDVRGYIDNEQLAAEQNELAYKALDLTGDTITSGTIHSGRSETGYILYEYSRDWANFEIEYKNTALDFGINFATNEVEQKDTYMDDNGELSESLMPSEASGTEESSTSPAEPAPAETSTPDSTESSGEVLEEVQDGLPR